MINKFSLEYNNFLKFVDNIYVICPHLYEYINFLKFIYNIYVIFPHSYEYAFLKNEFKWQS